jgi:tRNA(fMet)-specific endonuclease VapC
MTLAELPSSPEYVSLRARVAQLPPDDVIATTIVTYEEQTRGWLAYAARSNKIDHQIKAYARLRRHLQNYLGWIVMEFDASAAREFQRLRSMRIRIGTSDLKIAAVAISLHAKLLSRNLVDFTQVPGLDVEDWTRSYGFTLDREIRWNLRRWSLFRKLILNTASYWPVFSGEGA